MKDQVRAQRLLVVLCIWSAIATGTLFYYSVYDRGDYLKKGDEISLRRGTIPAPRGQILDKDGVKLAWSETYYDLFLTEIPSFYLKKSSLFTQLHEVLGPFELIGQTSGESLIKRDVSPKMIKDLQSLLKQYRELSLRLRFERRQISNTKISAAIGITLTKHGLITGVSGYELEYDKELRGQPGSYVVMIDSRQRWIPGKWELEYNVVPGRDIILKLSREELEMGETRGRN